MYFLLLGLDSLVYIILDYAKSVVDKFNIQSGPFKTLLSRNTYDPELKATQGADHVFISQYINIITKVIIKSPWL